MTWATANKGATQGFAGADEAALLITCFRDMPIVVAHDTDWQTLARMARENGVLPLVHQTLAETGSEMPECFQVAARSSRNAAETLASELELLLQCFAEHGIEVLPLKGPVLALQLYGDATSRSCKDLDLLVRRDDFHRGEALLLEQGYAAGEMNDSERRFLRDGISVELHFDIAAPRVYQFDLDGIWSRSRHGDFRSKPIRVMSRDDLVLFLCSHGLSHGFSRLIWILDVARALEGMDPQGSRDLMSHAERAGLVPWLLIGCEVVRAMFPRRLPKALDVMISELPEETERARRAAARLFSEGLAGVANTYHRSYLVSGQSLIGHWRYRLSYLTPTAEDYRWAESRGIDRRLMPILRPFRLLQKYGPARAWRIIFPRQM